MNAIIESLNSTGLWFVKFAFPMLVQSSLLILVIFLLDRILRKKVRAVARYSLWMLVLLKLLLPVTLAAPTGIGYWIGGSFLNPIIAPTASQVVKPQLHGQNPVQLSDAVPLADGITSAGQLAAAELQNSSYEDDIMSAGGALPADLAAGTAAGQLPEPEIQSVRISWLGIAFLIWAAIAAAMVLLIVQRSMFVCGLIRQAADADEELSGLMEKCKRRLGMGARWRVGIKLSVNAASPAVCGLFRPVVLIPQNLPAKLAPHQLSSVLLHELAHVKRGDLWVNMVQALLQIFYFYNPLLWFANAVIRRVREQSVDEAVLVALGGQADEYPETLLNVATLSLSRPALSLRLIGVVESKSALSVRIKHMLARPLPKSAKLGTLGLLVLLLAAAVLLPMSAASQKPTAVTQDEKIEPAAAAKANIPREFLGRWQGQAQIIMTWCKQKQLPIAINIAADGAVAGTVGDAELRGATFERKSAFYTKLMKHKTKYWIRGNLTGPIVKREGITRKSVTILMADVEQGKIKGSLATSGKHVGSKKTMVLSTRGMVLSRPVAAATPAGHSIAIYLVTKPKVCYEAEKLELSDLVLADKPLVTQQDIRGYDWPTHTMYLNPSVAKRIRKLKGLAEPFVLVVDGKRLYLGAFNSVISSFVPMTPMIHVGPTFSSFQPKDAVRIYPPSDENLADPRNDQRLRKALQNSKLLKIPANSPKASVLTNLMQREADLKLQLAYAQRQFGPTHRSVQKAKAQIKDIQRLIKELQFAKPAATEAKNIR